MNQYSLFAHIPSTEGMDAVKAHASYSADRIMEGGTLRTPVACNGDLWVCVGSEGTMTHRTMKMYRLAPAADFDGTPHTYAMRSAAWGSGAWSRTHAMGSYHGLAVRSGGKIFVLCGPAEIVEGNEVNFSASSTTIEDEEDNDEEFENDDIEEDLWDDEEEEVA